MKEIRDNNNQNNGEKGIFQKAVETVIGAAVSAGTAWAVKKVSEKAPVLLDKAENKVKDVCQTFKDRRRIQQAYRSGYEIGRQRKIVAIKNAMRKNGIREDIITRIQVPYWEVSLVLSYEQKNAKDIEGLVKDVYRSGIESASSWTEAQLIESMRVNGLENDQISRILEDSAEGGEPLEPIVRAS